MTNLTVPLASDAATAQPVQLDAGQLGQISDRIDGRRALVVYYPPETPDGTPNTAWVWVGFDQGVRPGAGFPILPGGTWSISTRRPIAAWCDADAVVYTFAELDRIDPCDLPRGGR